MSLNHFELGRLLGEGAGGRVFHAVHRRSGVAVALKTATPASRREALGLERELAALAGLDHPAILHLYDHGTCGPDDTLAEGTRWMALEYASGGSLEDWEPDDWDTVHHALTTLLEGLAHAHSRGLIHRDLKPANVVRCAPADLRPGLKLADFGLAWALNRDRRGLVRAGSPAYMPPEQIRGQVDALGPGTDLYALACVAWQWTTGEPPTGWVDIDETLRRQVKDDPPDFAPRFEVPDGLEVVLRGLLAKRVADRPPSAAHVLSALRRLGRVRRGRWFRSGPLPVPVHWQEPEGAPSTAFLSGAGLGLFSLRDPAVVGRQREQDALWQALRRVSDRGRSEAVALVGPAGSGRRRLARWLAERARALGCADIHLLRDSTDLEAFEARPPEAASRPLVVVLDPELAGPATDLAGAALLDPTDHPALWVLPAAEQEPALEALDRLDGFQRLPLAPLPRQVLADFAAEHLGLERGLADAVAAGADGNPGLLVARVRTWVAREELVPTDRGFAPRPGRPLAAVPTLDALRQARLDGLLGSLREEEQLAVCLGALLGRQVLAAEWIPLLQRHGLSARHSPLRRLTQLGIVDPDAGGWVFRDPVLQAALIRHLSGLGDIARFHASAADVLADLDPTDDRVERRGRHLLAAGQRQAAWEVLDEALDRRRLAADWVRVRALVELLQPAEPAELTPRQRYLLHYFGALAVTNTVSAAAAESRALAMVDDLDHLPEDARAKGLRLAAEILAFGGSPHARRVYALTDPEHPRMRTLDAVLTLDGGDPRGAIERYEALFHSEHSLEQLRAANGLGRAYGQLEDAERADHWFGIASALNPTSFVPRINTAMVQVLHGSPARALELARAAAELAQDETMVHRGFVSLVLALAAVAARDRTWLERARSRALFYVDRDYAEDTRLLLQAVRTARRTALAEHEPFLDALVARLER